MSFFKKKIRVVREEEKEGVLEAFLNRSPALKEAHDRDRTAQNEEGSMTVGTCICDELDSFRDAAQEKVNSMRKAFGNPEPVDPSEIKRPQEDAVQGGSPHAP